jgi:hypothetical protein
MSLVNIVAQVNTIVATGTTQAIDPNGPQLLSFVSFEVEAGSPPLTITSPSTNTATLYLSNTPTSTTGQGFPLQIGKAVTIRASSTGGIFINGTAGNTYGLASGSIPVSS